MEQFDFKSILVKYKWYVIICDAIRKTIVGVVKVIDFTPLALPSAVGDRSNPDRDFWLFYVRKLFK
jgi:hypothetical protein